MGLASLFEQSEIPAPIPFELVDRAELIRLQQSDPELSQFFESVGKGDDRYVILSGVLIRNWRNKLDPPESSIHQIVVPSSLRVKLLQIAHDIPASGHLGVSKTQNRLLRHFFGHLSLATLKTIVVLAMFANELEKVKVLHQLRYRAYHW